ncbi:MAG TPA: hypothetical protein VMB74_08620 [Streptosporangiaceae bacterium]|nr:hypothetical protein [Streptosporangiaceae bacterium]
MRMRRKARHNGLAQLAKIVREAGQFGVEYPGVDEQHAGPPCTTTALLWRNSLWVDQHTLRDLP